MIPSVGAKLGKSAKAVPNWSSSRPPASAMSDEMSVRAIAATEPEHERQHEHRHRDADQLADGGRRLLGLVDDRAVTRDLEAGTLADLGGLLEPLTGFGAQCRGGASYSTGTKAIRPSSESRPLPCSNGLGAAVTCGCARSSSTVRSIAARPRGPAGVPESTAKTTFAVSPASAAKRSSSTSIAVCDSVPGVLKSSTNEPPPAPVAMPKATSTTATIASERFQCSAAQAARFQGDVP